LRREDAAERLQVLKRFTIWLDAKTLKELAAWAEELDRPVGWLIRKIVVDALSARKAQ
jgi:hypothetical protein